MTPGTTVKTPTGKFGELIAIYPASFEHPARAEVRITVAIRSGTWPRRPATVTVLYALADVERCTDEVTP